jgi:hypothetical protein
VTSEMTAKWAALLTAWDALALTMVMAAVIPL